MLETVSDILNLLFDQLLLLLFNVELSLTVISEGKVIDVLNKLLSNVSESLEPTSQQKESFDVVFASGSHSPLQRDDFLIDTALLIT